MTAISDRLADALAKWHYCHYHPAEVTDSDRKKAVEDLLHAVHEENRVEVLSRAERVRRYGWHPPGY
jgi:hypothetical protein